jgi:acyl-CoA dehydrogenase
VTSEEFDHFHSLIVTEEIIRIGCGGVADSLGSILAIALPPVIKFCNPELRDKVVQEVLSG